MSYTEQFKELLKTTAKGFGIGLVISIILTLLIGASDAWEFIGLVFWLTILIGSIISIIICSRSGAQGYMSKSAMDLAEGVSGIFSGGMLGGGALLFVFGILKLFIGLIVMIPLGIFMALSYFLNLLYLGIMTLLEKMDKLSDKEELCETLDKAVPILAAVITVVLCIMIISRF